MEHHFSKAITLVGKKSNLLDALLQLQMTKEEGAHLI